MVGSAFLEMASIGTADPLLDSILNPNSQSRVVVAAKDVLIHLGLPSQSNFVSLSFLVLASLLYLAHGGLLLAQQYVTAGMGQRLRRETKLKLFRQFLYADYAELTRRGRGAILYAIEGPATAVNSAIVQIGTLFTGLITSILMLALMIKLSWWATMVVGVVGVGGIYAFRKAIDVRARKRGAAIFEYKTGQSTLATDAIDGVKTVKAYRLEERIIARMGLLVNMESASSVRIALFRNLPAFINEATAAVIVVGLGALSFLRPAFGLTFQDLITFLAAIRRCGPAVASINSSSMDLQVLRKDVETIEEVLALDINERSGDRPIAGVSSIAVENVFFRYAARPDQDVLQGVHFEMKKGTVTAIVGHTGSGKSTLASLLLGLYRPSDGAILVDGVPVQDLQIEQWRRKIGYVSQDVFMFNGTIRENISLGDNSVSDAQIRWAAKLAQLDEFVMGLPSKYDTAMGDRGVQLSGGQAQRVAIARAILLKPEVLIFDEATSALDNLTEQAVYEAIRVLRADAIIISIAHRLSTIRDASQIIVLESGRVIESGTHDALVQAGGTYSRLYASDADGARRVQNG